jgi:hypothetical protein
LFEQLAHFRALAQSPGYSKQTVHHGTSIALDSINTAAKKEQQQQEQQQKKKK